MLHSYRLWGMSSPSQNFGTNLTQRREMVGWSQERLAQAMRDNGFKWHQTTVYGVEKGERKLQLDEAHALASLLNVSLDRMISTPEKNGIVELWSIQSGALRQSFRLLRAAADDFEARRGILASFLDAYSDHLSPAVVANARAAIKEDAAKALRGAPEDHRWLSVLSPGDSAEIHAGTYQPATLEQNVTRLAALDKALKSLRSTIDTKATSTSASNATPE